MVATIAGILLALVLNNGGGAWDNAKKYIETGAHGGKRSDPLLKRLSSWLYYSVFSWLADMDYDPQAGNFRILSRKVIDNYRNMRERSRFFGSLINWMGFPAASIDVQRMAVAAALTGDANLDCVANAGSSCAAARSPLASPSRV